MGSSPATHRVVARPVGMVVLVATAAMVLTGLASVGLSVAGEHGSLLDALPLWLSAPLGALGGPSAPTSAPTRRPSATS